MMILHVVRFHVMAHVVYYRTQFKNLGSYKRNFIRLKCMSVFQTVIDQGKSMVKFTFSLRSISLCHKRGMVCVIQSLCLL